MRSIEKSGWIVIGITIAAILLGLFAIGRRQGSQGRLAAKNACFRNLQQINRAIQPWALETKRKLGDSINVQEVAGYIQNGVMPHCPAGGEYTIGQVGKPVLCSYPGHSL